MANIWEKAISILEENLNLGRSYLITTVNHNTTCMHTVHHKELSYCKSKVMKVDFSWLSVAKNMTIWCRSHLPSSLHYGRNLQILSIFKFACTNNRCVGWSINYVVWKLVISLSQDNFRINFLDNLDTFQSWFNLASFKVRSF